ncbi:hypothetical protein GCM10009680_05590 [Streptomyces yatensis]|uniref:Uncharacterized protein n=1 Tax=Streptomyces yatensis TaxID=155177 RepID=A0ABN2GCA6_9ACTN
MLEEVVKAYGGGVLSLETAVAMLVEAGYPIKDAVEEVERIRAKAQEEAAARMAEAVARRGDVDEESGDGEEPRRDAGGGGEPSRSSGGRPVPFGFASASGRHQALSPKGDLARRTAVG